MFHIKDVMIEPEFSRPTEVARLGAGVKRYKIEPTEQERKALAKRLQIVSVDKFFAEIALSAKKRGAMVILQGSFEADVTQSCVVTLEPVKQHIEETFSLVYSEQSDKDGLEIDVHYDDCDPPEPIVDGKIDIAEAACEHLALALDPFPRVEGAHFVDIVEDDTIPAPERVKGAFDALAALKKK